VPTPREERIASNEALFRLANERMAGWEERQESDSPELYLCECGDPDCKQKVALSPAEYEQVRSNSRRFFVVAGHEALDVESVLERHGDWLLIEKDPEVTELVEKLDPRNDS
jgi:hypothetical protein